MMRTAISAGSLADALRATLPGFARLKLGIGGKLQLAFGAAAAMTIIAATVAIVSFSTAGRGVQYVTSRQVPAMIDAMRLSVISGQISEAAARFVSADNDAEQKSIGAAISQKSGELTALLEQVGRGGGDSDAFAKVQSVAQRLGGNLKALEKAISERSELGVQLAAQLDGAHKVHARIAELLAPIIDDSYFDVMVALDKGTRAGAQEDEAARASSLKTSMTRQINSLRNAMEIGAQSHLVTNVINEGSRVKEAASLVPLQDQFKAGANALNGAVNGLRNDQIKGLAADLLRYGQGDGNVFGLRDRQLAAANRATSTIKENVALQRELDQAIEAVVSEAEGTVRQSAADLVGDLNRNRDWLFAVGVASIIAAFSIGFFYVQRRLIRRLASVGDAMRRLSAGDTDLKLQAAADHDEIGDMARSLEVFRAAEIERRGFAEREGVERVAQARRATTIEQMIGDFRAGVTAMIGKMADTVGRLETTARTLSSIAGGADQEARAASASSETTSSNVRTVAGAAEELGNSIREISEQTAQAKDVVERAAAIAGTANQRITELSEGTDRVGNVVKLIRDIAEQTNLLALNATIEAARAGDAGRGFAVVASEVKSLATETAKATEEISGQIGAIQSSTSEAVGAIRSIGEIMGEISQFTVGIAAAVEEQSASTQEIARNVQEAAGGAKELAGSMNNVTDAIKETYSSANAVLGASNAIGAQANELEQAVDAFLKKVATA